MLPAKKHLMGLKRTRNFSETRSKYLRLDKNENLMELPGEFIEMAKEIVTSDFLASYPEVESLYGKVSKWIGCKEDNVYISAGSDASIKSVFEVFVEPKDKVILLSPTYAMFYVYSDMFQADLTEIKFDENLEVSTSAISGLIETIKPKLICIANPNSPTGTVIQMEGLKKIIKSAAEQNSIILIDEAYYLFSSITAVNLINEYPQLIITRTFSKAFGLASARLGLAISHSDTISLLLKVRPMYETNAFAVKYAEIILDNYDIVEKNMKEVQKGKEFLEKNLDKRNMRYFKSYANFILIEVGSYERSLKIQKMLYDRKILIKGGFENKVLNKCIRVSIGNIEQMQIFLNEFYGIIDLLERQERRS